ncbi:putative Fe-S protein YdhL (DUF1289 family) [Rahnella sp. BIGb0603]|nr:putative Fe-S protein YdhL (DUF1289 family) [Rahnella sp. BIGb0603]
MATVRSKPTADAKTPAISASNLRMDTITMFSTDDVFQRLASSPFRQRFHLGPKEYEYCMSHGPDTVAQHAADFISRRLAPAEPQADGRQTPMRGHPVFIAQHATATCCRGCLEKWHRIAAHAEMTQTQQDYTVAVILHWIHQEMQRPAPAAKPRKAKSKNSDPQQMDLL